MGKNEGYKRGGGGKEQPFGENGRYEEKPGSKATAEKDSFGSYRQNTDYQAILENDKRREAVMKYSDDLGRDTGEMELQQRLPLLEKANIPREKIANYCLKDENKARAFELALGYNSENADDLIENIRKNIKNYPASRVHADQYGERYSVLMELKGPNGKSAMVKTAWLKSDTEMRLVSAYVVNRKNKRKIL